MRFPAKPSIGNSCIIIVRVQGSGCPERFLMGNLFNSDRTASIDF